MHLLYPPNKARVRIKKTFGLKRSMPPDQIDSAQTV